MYTLQIRRNQLVQMTKIAFVHNFANEIQDLCSYRSQKSNDAKGETISESEYKRNRCSSCDNSPNEIDSQSKNGTSKDTNNLFSLDNISDSDLLGDASFDF